MKNYEISYYYALAMLEASLDPKAVQQIVAKAHIKMDELSTNEAREEVIKKMKSEKTEGYCL